MFRSVVRKRLMRAIAASDYRAWIVGEMWRKRLACAPRPVRTEELGQKTVISALGLLVHDSASARTVLSRLADSSRRCRALRQYAMPNAALRPTQFRTAPHNFSNKTR